MCFEVEKNQKKFGQIFFCPYGSHNKPTANCRPK